MEICPFHPLIDFDLDRSLLNQKHYKIMKKKQSEHALYACLYLILLKMKLTLLILFIAVIGTWAVESHAQSTRLTFKMENSSIEEVLKEIEDHSEFRFFYNGIIDVDQLVSVDFKDRTVADVLKDIFEGTDIQYKVMGRQIMLSVDNSGLNMNRATQGNVKGKVTNINRESIPGVTIVVKGTTQGTITDAQGNYSLAGIPGNATLVFSFIGMKTIEIPAKGEAVIDVVMEEETIDIEEVVAIGYGSIKKSVLTGAISSVQMETLQPVASQRVDQMLQGRAAGVLVLNTDGSPGGNTTIRIRGMNSIQGGNNALIVVDGFQGGDLTAINPRDIASIEILKDASATAIYGAQGANGVVLIETKRGKTDKPVINYSSEFGFSNLLMGGVELMNAAEYAREQNRYEMADNFEKTPIPIFTDAEIAEFERTGGTNWIDEVYRTGTTQTHQISLSGRTNKLNYFTSGSFYNQKGIMINSGYKRYSLRANLIADVNDWVKFNLNWDASQQDRNGPQFGADVDLSGNPVLGAVQFAPTIPVYDENGNYTKPSPLYGERTLFNPVASALETLNENERTTNNINLYLDFTLMDGLTLRVGGGIRLSDYMVRQFLNSNTFTGNQLNGSAYAYASKSKSFQSSNILTYTKDFGKHHVNAIVVGEVKYDNSYSFSANNSDFTVQQTGVYDLGGANIQRTVSAFSERKINSAITRVNYGYADKYVFAASFRADGSSVFGANEKWAYFPSLSLGWRLSEEAFISKLGLFNNLMLRGSWGKTGNQAISTYQTLARISSYGFYPWDGGNNVNLGFQISSASNPNLKWETTTQSNIGLDLAMFRSRLRVSVEYYDKVTDDLLIARELPRTTGLSSIIDNVGSMGNKGWEFQIDGDINIGKLKWTAGLSFTKSTTTVLDLGDAKYISYAAGGAGHLVNIPIMFLRPGERFGNIMGFGYEGTWKLGEEEKAARYGQMPGDPKYTDVNDDGKIDYDNDFMVIGNSLPDYIFGLNAQFKLDNWELTFLLQGTHGNNVFNVARSKRVSTREGYSTEKLNRWTPENQNTDVPALHSAQYRHDYQEAWNEAHPDNPFINTITFPASGSQALSRWIEDASYVRLKNLTLAYNLPVNNSNFIKNLRIFASGTNLFTITKYKGFDPEVSSFTDSDARLGTDYNSYPNSRFINFGVDITF
jgi:TonB-linked SusC/RagA family outer membrane protein